MGLQCLQSQNIQEAAGLQPLPRNVLRMLYLASEREREKHSQWCPKPTPLARGSFEIKASQEKWRGPVSSSSLECWCKAKRRHSGRWQGEERRDVVFLFWAVLLYLCREDGDDEGKELRAERGPPELSVFGP